MGREGPDAEFPARSVAVAATAWVPKPRMLAGERTWPFSLKTIVSVPSMASLATSAKIAAVPFAPGRFQVFICERRRRRRCPCPSVKVIGALGETLPARSVCRTRTNYCLRRR